MYDFEVVDRRGKTSERLSDEYFYRNVLVSYFTGHKPTPQQRAAARTYWRTANCQPDYIEVFPGVIVGWIDGEKEFEHQLYDANTGMFLKCSDDLGDLPFCCELHFIGIGELYQEENLYE